MYTDKSINLYSKKSNNTMFTNFTCINSDVMPVVLTQKKGCVH